MPVNLPPMNTAMMQAFIEAQNRKNARPGDTARATGNAAITAVANIVNQHYKNKEMKLMQAKADKEKELTGLVDYLQKNNILQLPAGTTGETSVQGYTQIPSGMQEMLKNQGIAAQYSQPRESKVQESTLTPERYAQVITAYKDKPEILKKLNSTLRVGMGEAAYIKAFKDATQEAPGLRPGQQSAEFKSEKDLRSEFENMTKEFRLIENNMNRIKASVTEPSAAGDLSLIYNYMKMLDPTSVVRESEFATAATTGSYGERIKASVNRLLKGERLSEEIRNDFVDRANKLYEQQIGQYNTTKTTYTNLAKEYNLDPKKIVIDISGRLGKEEKKPIIKSEPAKRVIKF